jgi:hypothetical protein
VYWLSPSPSSRSSPSIVAIYASGETPLAIDLLFVIDLAAKIDLN